MADRWWLYQTPRGKPVSRSPLRKVPRKSGFQLLGEGSIEPPKTGTTGGGEGSGKVLNLQDHYSITVNSGTKGA